jgi:hypothetical protein
MTRIIGVAISRLGGDLLVVETAKGKARILFEAGLERPAVTGVADLVGQLLDKVPREFGKRPVSIALSAGEFASVEGWPLPEGARTGGFGIM